MVASTKFGKYIRTHSFRVSRISDLLENTDIRNVAIIIGHRSTNSTKVYNRVRVDYDVVYRLFNQHRSFNHDKLLDICKNEQDIEGTNTFYFLFLNQRKICTKNKKHRDIVTLCHDVLIILPRITILHRIIQMI